MRIRYEKQFAGRGGFFRGSELPFSILPITAPSSVRFRERR
jgi:hypothetical protein